MDRLSSTFWLALLWTVTFSPERILASSDEFSMRGALFYDRGHYWIEVAFRDAQGRDTLPPGLAASRFEICGVGEDSVCFAPSRIEVLRSSCGTPGVLLVSARIEGRRCYTVFFWSPDGSLRISCAACDPFAAESGGYRCAARDFFSKYVASAFAHRGDCYKLSRLFFQYESKGSRSAVDFVLEPEVAAGPWSFGALISEESLSRIGQDNKSSWLSRRNVALGIKASSWISGLRFSGSLELISNCSIFESDGAGVSILSKFIELEFRVRFDNLFDAVNISCNSVFEGVEAAFGYDWLIEDDSSRGSFFRGPLPFATIKATWTFLYGFRVSYLLLSLLPASKNDDFIFFRSLRFRLLLRDIFEAYPGKAWHPDLELAWDKGKRAPILEEEERLSIGFNFDLYPR